MTGRGSPFLRSERAFRMPASGNRAALDRLPHVVGGPGRTAVLLLDLRPVATQPLEALTFALAEKKAGDTYMRKLGFFAIFVSFFLFAGCASATTYYISFSSGSNGNNGTSESTPWKTHPYMQTASACTGTGSAPNYSHSSGDQFVFKQGDSWPNACFDMTIQNGGQSGNPDVYTFDPTWGTAKGTTGNLGQAVGTFQFNAGGAVINGADGLNDYIFDAGSNYILFNGMEMTGASWTGGGSLIFLDEQTSTNVILSNCYAHGWTHSGATGDNMNIMRGNGNSPYNVGSRLTGCVIDGTNSGGSGISDSGATTFAVPLSDNNVIRNVSNGLLLNANGVAYNNLIGPVNQSFDTTDHENCIEPIDGVSGGTSNVYIYNNVLHDCTAVNILTQGVASSGSNENDYIWNNVLYVGSVSSPPIPIQCDSSLTPNTGSSCHVWNNTIYAGSTAYCMRTIDRGNGNFAVLDIENNHCISGQGLITAGITGSTYTNTDNLLMSLATAASQGYASSEANAYSPTSATSGTVGAAANLMNLATGATVALASDTTYGGQRLVNARPASGAWDVGAYSYSSTAAVRPQPPTGVTAIAK
jgi:hypothetical protein